MATEPVTTLTNFVGAPHRRFPGGLPRTMTGSLLRRLQELAAPLGRDWNLVGERRRRRIWRAACQSAVDAARGLLLVEHLRAQAGLGVRYAELGGAPVGRSEQPPDPSRDGILGQRRLVHLTQLLQAGLLVLDAQ
jgi:hypothetical protein